MARTSAAGYARHPLALRIALSLGGALAAFAHHAHATPPPVTNCDDDGAFSLRAAIADPATISGDTIDLTQLACSEISLTSGGLGILQNDLTLLGPGSDKLTIRVAMDDRVALHVGTGFVSFSGMTLRDGKIYGNGGCIYSAGTVELVDAVVTGCTAAGLGNGSAVRGGGVYAKGEVIAVMSAVTSNMVYSERNDHVFGGGIAAASGLDLKYSTVSDNASLSSLAYGGGVWAYGNARVSSSTISGNSSLLCGGICLTSTSAVDLLIENSTFSYNRAYAAISAIGAFADISVNNSTIAFNTNLTDTPSAAVFVAKNMHLDNTIIGANETIGLATEADLFAEPQFTVTGSGNLVGIANVPLPADTLHECPHLGPLTDNGGPTRTHMPLASSLALDGGSTTTLSSDQRGKPRVTGAAVDIGAVERQPGEKDDRILLGTFDAVCT